MPASFCPRRAPRWRLASYDTYTSATHALCCAHVLRELIAVFDTVPDQRWCWARQAHDALRDSRHLVDAAKTAGHTSVDPATRDLVTHRLR